MSLKSFFFLNAEAYTLKSGSFLQGANSAAETLSSLLMDGRIRATSKGAQTCRKKGWVLLYVRL